MFYENVINVIAQNMRLKTLIVKDKNLFISVFDNYRNDLVAV